MVDVHSSEIRHKNMAAIKNKDTKPELWLRKELFRQGFRYRTNVASLPGKPDIVFPKYRAAIFVNGCFWHMHDCSLFKLPKTRTEFWGKKLSSNKRRDAIRQQELLLADWRVCIVWECSMKGVGASNKKKLIHQVSDWLISGSVFIDIKREIEL